MAKTTSSHGLANHFDDQIVGSKCTERPTYALRADFPEDFLFKGIQRSAAHNGVWVNKAPEFIANEDAYCCKHAPNDE